MRFYRHSRKIRIALTLLWTSLVLFWLGMTFGGSHLHRLMPYLWLLICALQIATTWTYWEINEHDLSSHALGIHRRFQFAQIDYAGSATRSSKALAKTVQVDYRGRRSLYITVADRERFLATLQEAIHRHPHQPFTTGPLGLQP